MGAPDPNLAQLADVAVRLGDLLGELTLVGGCAAGLLVTDPGSAGVRRTMDVDLVVRAKTYVEYEAFAERLRRVGCERAMAAREPLCRWRLGGSIVDVMPLDEKVLGFTNRWYASAVRRRIASTLSNGVLVHHIDGPHFLASKLEAYSSRGGGEAVTSHDLEDMVRVIDGRETIARELGESPRALRDYVRSALRACMADRFFVEALPGYFLTREEGRTRTHILFERLRRLASDDGERSAADLDG